MNHLESVRRICRLSLVDLSRETGLSVSMLSRLENDERKGSADTISRVSKALGIDKTLIFFQMRRKG